MIKLMIRYDANAKNIQRTSFLIVLKIPETSSLRKTNCQNLGLPAFPYKSPKYFFFTKPRIAMFFFIKITWPFFHYNVVSVIDRVI